MNAAEQTADVAETVTSDTSITITFFPPGEKSKGTTKTTTWTKFFHAVSPTKPTSTVQKEKLAGWAPATFTGNHRKKANVVSVCAAVFDFDNAIYIDETVADGATNKVKKKLSDEQLVTLDRAMAAFPGVTRFAYTSWSHDPTWPHFRLVIPYTRAVTGEEQERLWEMLAGKLTSAGITFDTACKDASRLWFLPARRDDSFETRFEAGALFDVDAVLTETKVEPAADLPPPTTTETSTPEQMRIPPIMITKIASS